jgi:TonB family protein
MSSVLHVWKIDMLSSHINLARICLLSLLACMCLPVVAGGAHASVHAQEPSPSANAAASPDTARGIALYKQGDFKAALKVLRAVVKKEKENADAWLYLGLSHLKADERKKAREAVATAHKLRPADVNTLNVLAYTLLMSGDEHGAQKAAMDAIKLDKQNMEAHYFLATVSYRLGRYAQALEEAEIVLKLNPKFAPALYLKGQALLSLSDQAQSTAGNETPEMRSLLAEKSTARFVEAVQTLETFIRVAPDAPEVAKLREDLTQMRLYRDAVSASNPNRTIFSARDVTQRAVIQWKPEPLYTEQARHNQVRGTVRLRIVLGGDGRVQHIYPTSRLPDGLTEAAINAARKIKFIPAIKDGRPVSQFVIVEYNFNIY